jgi:hypothetical protein
MSKQLLIYESAVPVTVSSHGDLSFEPTDDYSFGAGINAVPLMAVEIVRAATEYAIVFTEHDGEVFPAVVLGAKPDQNLYVSTDARWRADYVPAFIRRYPFVFSLSADQQTLTLCIDETHSGFNRDGRGHRLFDEDGEASDYTNQVLKFLQQYQADFERTRAFGKALKDLNLLEPMQAEVKTPSGETLTLNGFQAVTRNRLRTLSADALSKLARTDELELIYLHLYSLRNFNVVKERLFDALASASANGSAKVQSQAEAQAD